MSASDTAWQPLRHGLFRNPWLASIASSIGTRMHEVGAGWLMTSVVVRQHHDGGKGCRGSGGCTVDSSSRLLAFRMNLAELSEIMAQ